MTLRRVLSVCRVNDRSIDRSRRFSRAVICGLHARFPVGIVVDRRNGDQSGANRLGCYRVNGSYLRSASSDLLSLTALPSRLARPRGRLGNVAWARTRARETGAQVEAGGNRTNLGKKIGSPLSLSLDGRKYFRVFSFFFFSIKVLCLLQQSND